MRISNQSSLIWPQRAFFTPDLRQSPCQMRTRLIRQRAGTGLSPVGKADSLTPPTPHFTGDGHAGPHNAQKIGGLGYRTIFSIPDAPARSWLATLHFELILVSTFE
jgi:hypothetical protein